MSTYVDPLAILNAQSSICRQCRENRQTSTWTRKGSILFSLLDEAGFDTELSSRREKCCETNFENGEKKYTCAVFQDLVDGYGMGLTVGGANMDPCKNCATYVDNGGKCIGDQCKEGPFYVNEGASLIRM